MMKKAMVVVMGLMVASAVFAQGHGMRPGRMAMMEKAHPAGGAMLVMLIDKHRGELNLAADQSAKLDRILEDIKAFRMEKMEGKKEHRDDMLESFASDSFDPARLKEMKEAEHKKHREEVEAFMDRKMKEVHGLLTPDQRKKVVEIAKAKREKGHRCNERRPQD